MRNGRLWRNFIQICGAVFLAAALAGCGEVQVPVSGGFSEESAALQTMGYTDAPEYDLPEDIPGVIVNPEGYEIGFEKVAVFIGDRIPQYFRIYEKESGMPVFYGEIIKKDEGTGQGYFTELEMPGEYYIFCDGLGSSRGFVIEESRTEELTASVFAGLPGREDNAYTRKFEWIPDPEKGTDTTEVCREVILLLSAYEYYPAVYEAEEAYGETGAEILLNGLKDTVSFLLTMQAENGGVYGGYNNRPSLMLREVSTEATLLYASALAKFGFLYQQKDWSYANTCLKSAALAWQYLEKEGVLSAAEAAVPSGFAAAAELYRATNDYKYHNYILLHREEIRQMPSGADFLQAQSTYLLTRRKTDRSLSGELMNRLLAEARDISDKSKKELYTVRSEDFDRITLDMAVMAVADYVITNHEYASVIRNHFHYLQGRNSTTAEMQSECSDVQTAALVLPLGAIQ